MFLHPLRPLPPSPRHPWARLLEVTRAPASSSESPSIAPPTFSRPLSSARMQRCARRQCSPGLPPLAPASHPPASRLAALLIPDAPSKGNPAARGLLCRLLSRGHVFRVHPRGRRWKPSSYSRVCVEGSRSSLHPLIAPPHLRTSLLWLLTGRAPPASQRHLLKQPRSPFHPSVPSPREKLLTSVYLLRVRTRHPGASPPPSIYTRGQREFS